MSDRAVAWPWSAVQSPRRMRVAVFMLIVARFLSAIAVGVVVSAGMAAVVDLGGPERRRQAASIASVRITAMSKKCVGRILFSG